MTFKKLYLDKMTCFKRKTYTICHIQLDQIIDPDLIK